MSGPLALGYIQNAVAAGFFVALLSACVGYFIVLRGAAFATHALAQIGFSGAAGAVLLGVDPLAGLIAFTVVGALGLGITSSRPGTRDVFTALVLVTALGAGALFLTLARTYAANVYALLFGTIVGVGRGDVLDIAAATVAIVVCLATCARPLLFATVARETARSRGVAVRVLDMAFLVLVGLTVALTVPIVGALLIYSLAIGPSAAAGRLTLRPLQSISLAFLFAIAATWGGTALAYLADLPVGFFISAIALLEFVAAGALAAATRATR